MGVGWEGKWLAHLLIYAPPVLDYMSGCIIVLYSLRQLVSPFNLIQLPDRISTHSRARLGAQLQGAGSFFLCK